MNRRSFGRFLSAFPFLSVPATAESIVRAPAVSDRTYWRQTLLRTLDPVLNALQAGQLRATMPIESAAGARAGRAEVSHLEALGRSLAGLAPWLEHPASAAEQPLQQRYRDLSRAALAQAVDPASPDFMNFTKGGQPVVDTAFLAHALLRAPEQLWQQLPAPVQTNLVKALQSSRVIKPGYSNWLLFSAIIEAALLRFTGSGDLMRMDYAIKQHLSWYKGDGVYGDGPDFHWDYYNSYVIQPMLIDVVQTLVAAKAEDPALLATLRTRGQRYAAVQERLISPDGSFAAIGRSLAYRCGAFQLLGQMALQHNLPAELPPAQVRSALTAVIRRTMDAPGTYDRAGWLQIGLCGHQPALGETYISTGSLYLCSVGFLPLGLPETDPFWSDPAQDWTARKIWSGGDVPVDHAIRG
ncbi:DUF2264 domain-containing protein [Spirosoma luteolum]